MVSAGGSAGECKSAFAGKGTVMKILIAGGGIGGLTAALALLAKGHEVALFEQSADMGEVGAGLQLGPNALRVLFSLGLEEALTQVSFEPQGIELRDHASGRLLTQIPLGERARARYGLPYFHIHRADLHRLLREAVAARSPGTIRTEAKVNGLYQNAGSATLIFEDGAVESGDLIVGADGIHSAVRTALFGAQKPIFKKMMAWRGLVPAERLKDAGLRPVVTSWLAPHAHAITYYVRGGELVNFVGVVERDTWISEAWMEPGSREELRRDFGSWHPTLSAVAEAVENPFRWALHARAPLASWSSGRVTLLGDACHPMLPFLAQGAAMAIEDACILAASLETGPLPDALARYEAVRKPRASKVQAQSETNAGLFHLAHPVMRRGVHFAMAAGSKLLPGFTASRYDWLMKYDATEAL